METALVVLLRSAILIKPLSDIFSDFTIISLSDSTLETKETLIDVLPLIDTTFDL